MYTKLRKEAKNDFEKDFFKLMNNAVFRKTMENVRKHRDMKLVTTDKRRTQLAVEPNYHTTKYFLENLMAIEMKETKVKMNKLIYLGMSMLVVAKKLYMNCGMITLNQNIKTERSYVTWILTALVFILKLKTLLTTLKNGLTHQTTAKMIVDYF